MVPNTVGGIEGEYELLLFNKKHSYEKQRATLPETFYKTSSEKFSF